MQDNEKLTSNIQAREAAESCFEFICEEWQNVPPRFWERLIELARLKLPAQEVTTNVDNEMDHLAAMRFERQHMPPRGAHASEAIGNVPCDYLAWWCDAATDNFTKQLQRYVRSARFREREQAEG